MQLRYTVSYQQKRARVYHDPEWREFVVRFYAGGLHMDGSDYHTDDYEDAVATARAAVRDEREWCEANSLSGS